MSRHPVFADRLADPAVAARLREHREDRDALLERLQEAFRVDARVRAAWLWGSLGRGEADDLSDLDLWVVADDAVAGMGAVLAGHTEQAGHLIHAGEGPQNAPPDGGYLGALLAGRQGLLHIDWYWQPASAIRVVPARGVLLNRLVPPVSPGDWQAVTGGQPGHPATTDRERIEGGVRFFWLMLSIAAKALARDPASDLGLVQYPRPGFEEAARLLGRDDLLTLDWSAPEGPSRKMARLRQLAQAGEHLTSAANTWGFDFSPLYAPCLSRYLDLVGSILASP